MFDAVRYLLFRWGFIETFRADNGFPFGDPSRQSLSALNLLLRALGICVKLNPPRSPTKNAKVERNQGTTARWADPANCEDYLDFQQKLNQAVLDQRENFPSRVCQNQTRAVRYPDLFRNTRRFHAADFDLQRVFDFLEKGAWQRKVSSTGEAAIFGKTYQIGFKHRGKQIMAGMDAKARTWVFKDEGGAIICSFHASNITEENLYRLSLSQ